AGAIGDMALAIDAKQAAVGIDDRDGIEARATGQLEEADRQHDLQFGGNLLEMPDRRIVGHRGGQLQICRVGLLAEVGRFEQLLNQDDLRTLAGGLAHQTFGVGDVRLAVPGTGHLGGGNGDDTGHGGLADFRRSKNGVILGDLILAGESCRSWRRNRRGALVAAPHGSTQTVCRYQLYSRSEIECSNSSSSLSLQATKMSM